MLGAFLVDEDGLVKLLLFGDEFDILPVHHLEVAFLGDRHGEKVHHGLRGETLVGLQIPETDQVDARFLEPIQVLFQRLHHSLSEGLEIGGLNRIFRQGKDVGPDDGRVLHIDPLHHQRVFVKRSIDEDVHPRQLAQFLIFLGRYEVRELHLLFVEDQLQLRTVDHPQPAAAHDLDVGEVDQILHVIVRSHLFDAGNGDGLILRVGQVLLEGIGNAVGQIFGVDRG